MPGDQPPDGRRPQSRACPLVEARAIADDTGLLTPTCTHSVITHSHVIPASHDGIAWYRQAMVVRVQAEADLQQALRRSPVVLIVGARQVGKTTLARTVVPRESVNYFDLEDPVDLARLSEPMLALGPLRGVVVDRRGSATSRPLSCAPRAG